MPKGFISPLACLGSPPEHRDYRWRYLNGELAYHQPRICSSAIIEAFATVDGGIDRKTYIGERVLLMKHSHVGHDAIIQDDCNIAPGAIIGGYCVIGQGTKVGLGALIRPRTIIGDYVVIGAGAVVVKDIPTGEIWVGNPAGKIQKRHPSDRSMDLWEEWYESWHPSSETDSSYLRESL